MLHNYILVVPGPELRTVTLSLLLLYNVRTAYCRCNSQQSTSEIEKKAGNEVQRERHDFLAAALTWLIVVYNCDVNPLNLDGWPPITHQPLKNKFYRSLQPPEYNENIFHCPAALSSVPLHRRQRSYSMEILPQY